MLDNPSPSVKFPYPVVFIAVTWMVLGCAYLYSRWRQRPKAVYIIPRVFVLCSPRTVQFHYELILRVGLPSYDYNPDKHDIDVTVQGLQRNEVVPMTRLNTKTLQDEPLITSLSIIVYRLVEMPPLGSLVLRHSGPFKAWLYVYDFTVIDLSTSKEQYFTINKYIGSLNRVYKLEEHNDDNKVHYPIDDVPLPPWSAEDMYLATFTVINTIMLSLTLMPINCQASFISDVACITLASINGGAVVFFLEWLLYYYARWNVDRREYFNLSESRCCGVETATRTCVAVVAIIIGAFTIYYALHIVDWQESIVWHLATLNSIILVLGTWNIARLVEMGEMLVSAGLRFRGVESVNVGMKYAEIVSDIHTKSASASNEGPGSTLSSGASRPEQIGPRSSVKSFGFDPITGHPSRRGLSRVALRGISSTGATPDQQRNLPIRNVIKQ